MQYPMIETRIFFTKNECMSAGVKQFPQKISGFLQNPEISRARFFQPEGLCFFLPEGWEKWSRWEFGFFQKKWSAPASIYLRNWNQTLSSTDLFMKYRSSNMTFAVILVYSEILLPLYFLLVLQTYHFGQTDTSLIGMCRTDFYFQNEVSKC